ncbi:MAG: ATP-dependent DNA helicase RecG [Phycisphaeraceae bacterium]|nr:ATP-dependent DNA helicase RecG [Phycisphaeraceae bacterium]
MPILLTTPIEEVSPAARRHAPALRALGVANAAQLIAHLPMRHELVEAEATIDRLEPGRIVTARGEITATRTVMKGRRPRFEAVLMDDTGRLDLVWFNQPFMRQRIHPGLRLRVTGPARAFGPGLQIANPKIEHLKDEAEPAATDSRLRPVYPASEDITSAQIDAIVRDALAQTLPLIEDHLPEAYRRERAMPSLSDAYRLMHQPESQDDVAAARRRLAYDELLLLQLGVQMKRAHLRETLRSPVLRWSEAIDRHIRERFPFPLTPSQDQVVEDIVSDLTRETPTNRLVQGDVGSGKTIVALYAMLLAAASDHQAALLAPTELLAEQHYASISRILAGSSVRIELLTGAMTGSERSAALARIESGAADLVVGTHAILTETVRFASLAVAIIDEQHRFGVHQRATMRSKGTGDTESNITPHVLVMTATPIPRTLALTLFGDLDVSTIREMPPGRQSITTRVVTPDRSAEVYSFVHERLDQGDQAYIVVPAIDTGDGDVNDLRTVHARLEAHELAGKRLAAVHGRLKRDTREHIMGRFREGLIDALVATTVIEVGVDVANATVMVVEHAERFGLAQLHQLRGRVGRGAKRSVAVLIGEPVTEDAAARLRAIAESSDGFVLAEKDMEIRGPGEVFGIRQAGAPPFRVADLARDLDLLAMARRDATAWIARSPALAHEAEALLRRRLLKAHGKWLGLGDVG